MITNLTNLKINIFVLLIFIIAMVTLAVIGIKLLKKINKK